MKSGLRAELNAAIVKLMLAQITVASALFAALKLPSTGAAATGILIDADTIRVSGHRPVRLAVRAA